MQAKYHAIESVLDKNTVHYTAIPDYVLMYNQLAGENKQEKETETENHEDFEQNFEKNTNENTDNTNKQ